MEGIRIPYTCIYKIFMSGRRSAMEEQPGRGR
jgi:hypothetical protein